MNDVNARQFVAQYAAGNFSPEEKAAFLQWLHGQPEEEVMRLLEEYGVMLEDMQPQALDAAWTARLNARIDELEETPVRKMRSFRWWAAAAAVLVLITAGIYMWQQPKAPEETKTVAAVQPVDVPPGVDQAVLTLADGTVIALDSAGNRQLQQGGTSIQQKGGQLVYHTRNGAQTVGYNTLRTPRGGFYQLVLPDGTKVWLNAASNLRYPTAFGKDERIVEVSGEAYFEVTKDAARPFRVHVDNKASVEVLGTSFNVNSYQNEKSLNITLLDGAVRVSSTTAGLKQSSVQLKPGQQAQLAQDIKVIAHADTDKVIAWKNGAFNFDNVSLEAAMRQLERWYNIDVVYEDGIPDIYFGGELPRNMSLNDLLMALEKSNVHFRIEDRKLVVTK